MSLKQKFATERLTVGYRVGIQPSGGSVVMKRMIEKTANIDLVADVESQTLGLVRSAYEQTNSSM